MRGNRRGSGRIQDHGAGGRNRTRQGIRDLLEADRLALSIVDNLSHRTGDRQAELKILQRAERRIESGQGEIAR